MVSRTTADRLKAAVAGALMVGAIPLLGLAAPIPDYVVTVAFLFGGGLVAGLLTPGTVRDGAVTGAFCGVLVALLVALAAAFMSLTDGTPQPLFWPGFLALILTPILLPYNAVGGAAGTAVRNGIRRRGATETDEWKRWIGIAVGAIVIAGSPLVIVFAGLFAGTFVGPFIGPFIGPLVDPLILASPLVGGFIAGFFAGNGPKDGFEAGLVAALFGTALFLLPILWTVTHETGFAAGLAGMVGIALGYVYLFLGTAAGVAGAVVRPGPRED